MRIITILLVAITVVACNEGKKTEDPVVVTEKPTHSPLVACDPVFEEFEEIADLPGRLAWLRNEGSVICNDGLEHCTQPYHVISDITFGELARLHPENTGTIKYYPVEWQIVKAKLSEAGPDCYKKHLGFIFKKDGTIELKLDTFSTSESFYSVPFMRSLESRLNLTGTTKLNFTKTFEEDEHDPAKKILRVIFTVKHSDGTDHFFNISNDPRFTFF